MIDPHRGDKRGRKYPKNPPKEPEIKREESISIA
jgi:hypothetical protein